jgi:hypothetical protein
VYQEKQFPTRFVSNEDARRTELQPFQVVVDLDGLAKVAVDISFIVESESGLFGVDSDSRPFNPGLEVVSETLGEPNSTLMVQELSGCELELSRSRRRLTSFELRERIELAHIVWGNALAGCLVERVSVCSSLHIVCELGESGRRREKEEGAHIRALV